MWKRETRALSHDATFLRHCAAQQLTPQYITPHQTRPHHIAVSLVATLCVHSVLVLTLLKYAFAYLLLLHFCTWLRQFTRHYWIYVDDFYRITKNLLSFSAALFSFLFFILFFLTITQNISANWWQLNTVTPKIYELCRLRKRCKSDRKVNPRFFSTFAFHFLIRVAPAGGGKEVKVKVTIWKKCVFFTFLSLFQFRFEVEFGPSYIIGVSLFFCLFYRSLRLIILFFLL